MKSEYNLFLEAMAKEPHDWFPRLVFADWLIEQGDPRGEMLHLLHDLLRFECEDRESKEDRYLELDHEGHSIPSPEFENDLDMKFVLIPPGEFLMGSPEEEKDRDFHEDQVKVTLSKGFWMGQHEVTQGLWKEMMGTTPWRGKDYVKEGENYAASYISHDDAVKFCEKLMQRGHEEGWMPKDWKVSLPTEAQWEYACRAGTTTAYHFGNDRSKLGEYAWYVENAANVAEDYAHEVGQKNPNGWNLYDMHGNVWEWCLDWYDESLPGGTDPIVTSESWYRVERGGCWCNFYEECRSAGRVGCSPPDLRSSDIGFRLAAVQASR